MTQSIVVYFHYDVIVQGYIVVIVAVYCPMPVDPQNGLVLYQGHLGFGSVITYICNFGYNLQGDAIQYCVGEGSWSSDPPTCTSKSPDLRKNSQIRVVEGIYNGLPTHTGSVYNG